VRRRPAAEHSNPQLAFVSSVLSAEVICINTYTGKMVGRADRPTAPTKLTTKDRAMEFNSSFAFNGDDRLMTTPTSIAFLTDYTTRH
jgi:hypothetical protein